MDVTLIVKASNQQCEDLTIKCEPSWTIRRLKGHLTEVYPGKPSSDEQKLIYSGQLLSDTVVLKDVLRQYDGQQAHTVHLVFTPKNSYYGNSGSGSGGSSYGGANKSNRNNTNVSGSGSSSTGNRMSTNPSTSTPAQAGSSAASGSSHGSTTSGAAYVAGSNGGGGAAASGGSSRERDETTSVGGDGLRQRTLLQTRPGLRTLPGPPPFMEQTAALQSLVQQTYMQYLNQYINLINEQAGVNALYSATGMPPTAGTTTTATPVNPLTGSPVFMPAPFVPVAQPAATAGAFPNFSYYPCMSTASTVGGLPSASSIPTSSAASGSVLSGAAAAAVATPGTSFLPSPSSIPSTSGAPGGSQQTPTASLLPGAAGPSIPSGASPEAGASAAASSAAAATAAQAAPGTDGAVAAPAQAGAAPQDGVAAVGEAGAPARARRFPNIVVEEQENNDWLDVFFSMCRVGILMTVIYLYSSPMRCLTVLFIGVMLYLKKHLDRVYQAIDRRLTRVPVAPEANAAQPQQPEVAQPNNHVPDAQAQQAARPEQDARGAPTAAVAAAAAEEQPTAAGSSTGQRDGAAAGPSSSQSATVPRPRTGPASRAASELAVNVGAGNAGTEAEPLLERPVPSGADSNNGTAAELPAAEGQRMTFNDMTSFLGTLVITFFTSIIPDTPAA